MISMKNCRTLFFVVATVGLLAGCNNSDKAAIENVLLRDALVTYQLPALVKQRDARVFKLMQQISLADVPQDFAGAYAAHIWAWHQYAEVAGKDDRVAQGSAAREVAEAFEKVKVIALSYGARLPPDGLLSPARYAAEFADDLAQLSAQKASPTQWNSLGASSSGCEWSYKTPVTRISEGVRFLVKANCQLGNASKIGDKSIEWRRLSGRNFVSCRDERIFTESSEFYDNAGDLIGKHEANYMGYPLDGPSMARRGIGGELLGKNSIFRKVFENECL